MKSEAAKLVEEMLVLVRKTFYAKVQPKQFFQERPRLIKAITFPAEYLNRRGATAPASLYRKILGTVIAAIKQHAGQIERFEIYFLHSVQEHMLYHGDEYYQQAKAPRHVAAILPKTIGRIRSMSASVTGDGGSTTRLLADLHKSIKIGGRPRSKSDDSAGDLFGACNATARPPKRQQKFLKPLQYRAPATNPPQTASVVAPDS